MLTRKQRDLLYFINDRLTDTGVPPSFEEMKDALNLKSKSGIHRLITALEERGFIRRLANRARALEVLRMPEANTSNHQPFKPSIVQGGLSNKETTGQEKPFTPVITCREESDFSIPVMGRIAAGTPISAIQDHSHSITVAPEFLASGEHFALEVHGDSMIEAGILDGDFVILRRQDTAITGDIIVALIDDEEATLKRLRRRGTSIALEAANPAYETRVLGPDRVKIQGKLVSLVRKY